MGKSAIPLQIVPASILAYGLLYRFSIYNASQSSLQATNRAISAGHTAVVTFVVLFVLSRSSLGSITPDKSRQARYAVDGNLDDSDNPLIQERSSFANAITAWETGYLLYDTWSMIHSAQTHPSIRGFARSAGGLTRRQPALLAHHVVLSIAFLRLQQYIYIGRERGIWIILVFLLMNGSNPFMHARWWARKQGRSTKHLDAAFAAVFTLSRFGSVAWALRCYGTYHGFGPMEAYRRLRMPCQIGTGALTGVNALWWLLIMNGIINRRMKGSSKRS